MAPIDRLQPVTVRPVRAGEWRELRALRLRALKTDPGAFGSTFAKAAAYPDSEWIERAEESDAGERTRTFVAVSDEDWRGMVIAAQLDDGDAGLFGMWVDSRDRREGVAAALVDAVVAWARERGAPGVSLSVADDNPAAAALFGSKGFVFTGERRPLPSRPEVGTLEMRRPLGDRPRARPLQPGPGYGAGP
jgi:ribosomal protein S18 acetylase RimI-like enzyme